MRARRELTQEELQIIKNYHSPEGAVRFSKKQLSTMGLPYDGGGLVRINDAVYAFVSTKESPKSYILGEGKYGKVKLLQNVEDPSNKKALKVLRDKSKNADLDAFQKELMISANLGRGSAQMIHKIGGAAENPHTSYCGILDLIEGVNLRDFLKSNKKNPNIDAAKRLKFLIDCLKEVNGMHKKGYLHNDVSPLNYMYDDKTDTLKIIDFGRTEQLPQAPQEKQRCIDKELSAFADTMMGYLTWNDIYERAILSDSEKKVLIDLRENMSDLGRRDYDGDKVTAESAIHMLENVLSDHLTRLRQETPVAASSYSQSSEHTFFPAGQAVQKAPVPKPKSSPVGREAPDSSDDSPKLT
jgi:serine/threonine protein kinase